MKDKVLQHLPIFQNHKLQVVQNTPDIQLFKCRADDTWQYGFFVSCANNNVSIWGDIGELMLNPGYTRGLRWLRGSIESYAYVYEKASREYQLHKDYSPERAFEALEQYLKDNDHTRDFVFMRDASHAAQEGLQVFQKFLYDEDFEEPHCVYDGDVREQVCYQLAALTWLCQELDKINFTIKGED